MTLALEPTGAEAGARAERPPQSRHTTWRNDRRLIPDG